MMLFFFNKRLFILAMICTNFLFLTSCAHRHIRTATDITPGNPSQQLGWQYGAFEIRTQTTKINRQLMDRWISATGYDLSYGKPRIVISEVDNRTDCYIPLDMVRDVIEGVSVDDGRYTIVVGDVKDERELNQWMHKISCDPKYSYSSRLTPQRATAPQFLAKIRLTKATTHLKTCDIEAYRMQVTLYDIETQEIVDSAWDILEKKVQL